ncbi:hypothetical protein ABFS82_12G178400 [Erythranthe guttata]
MLLLTKFWLYAIFTAHQFTCGFRVPLLVTHLEVLGGMRVMTCLLQNHEPCCRTTIDVPALHSPLSRRTHLYLYTSFFSYSFVIEGDCIFGPKWHVLETRVAVQVKAITTGLMFTRWGCHLSKGPLVPRRSYCRSHNRKSMHTSDIAYAKLANMDPQFGLYSSFVPLLIYAAMGSSRGIAIGPVAVVSLLLGLLQKEIDPKHKVEYQKLAFTATFFAGIIQFTLGFFRLGFLIDFLSHAAIVGFMAGAAITIGLQQLKGLLGVKTFTKKTDVVSVMRSVWSNVHHGWNWETCVIGITFLAFLLLTKYIGKRNKKLFWVPAIAPLISVIVATFCVFITRADKKGVQIVRHIERGLPPPSLDQIHFTGSYHRFQNWRYLRLNCTNRSSSNWENICSNERLSLGWE